MTTCAELNYPLQTGILKVTLDGDHDYNQVKKLFRVAERYNPKRSFLFVSTVLGKHFPSRVSEMDIVFDTLCQKLPDDISNFAIVGMAETAIGLGAGVYQKCVQRFGSGIYGTSTRFPVSSFIRNFLEPHSHATNQSLCLPSDSSIYDCLKNIDDLILVDDELTTGTTMSNLANTLLSQTSIQPKRIFVLSITDWSQSQLTLNLLKPTSVEFLSILKGKYTWIGNGNTFRLPMFTESTVSPKERMASVKSPRYWVECPSTFSEWPRSVSDFIKNTKKGESVLIVGTGEFMAKPLRVAQAIEEIGGKAYFSSTTRSPAIPNENLEYFEGYGVHSHIVFPDLYQGQGMNYLYNYDIHKWNRILLYTDAQKGNISTDFIERLKPDVIVSDFDLVSSD